ncbi:hypothetical protein QOT17_007571 [Balamuthia mandrillaris]
MDTPRPRHGAVSAGTSSPFANHSGTSSRSSSASSSSTPNSSSSLASSSSSSTTVGGGASGAGGVELTPKEMEMLQAITKEESEQEAYLRKKRELLDQITELRQGLIKEKAIREKEQQEKEEVERRFRELKEKYQMEAWGKTELEEQIMKLEKEIFFLKRQAEELGKANNMTSTMEKRVDHISDSSTKFQEDKMIMKDIVERLSNDLELLKNELKQKSIKKNSIATQLEKKKQKLNRKLKTKADIENVILQIETELATLKERFSEEIQSREQLEWIMNMEINELSRRLSLEAKAREEFKVMLKHALMVRSHVLSDISWLKDKIEHLEESKVKTTAALFGSVTNASSTPSWTRKTATQATSSSNSPSVEKQEEEVSASSSPNQRPQQVLSAMEDLEKELEEMKEMLSFDDSVLMAASFSTTKGGTFTTTGNSAVDEKSSEKGTSDALRRFKELKAQVEDGLSIKMELVEKTETLDKDYKQLKDKLDQEVKKREELEAALEEERTARKELERKVNALLQNK